MDDAGIKELARVTLHGPLPMKTVGRLLEGAHRLLDERDAFAAKLATVMEAAREFMVTTGIDYEHQPDLKLLAALDATPTEALRARCAEVWEECRKARGEIDLAVAVAVLDEGAP